MISVALLRGINVGGKNKVEMARLRSTFESIGLRRVSTYINTGNVIFDPGEESSDLPRRIEAAISQEFGLDLRVLVRDFESIRAVEESLPGDWTNDSEMKCDVLFLWDDVDAHDVLDKLPTNDAIDDVRYVPGAILWRVDRAHLTRSGMTKIVGTALYTSMTIRNCNTVRKLVDLMAAASVDGRDDAHGP